jgi:hypothetical protein
MLQCRQYLNGSKTTDRLGLSVLQPFCLTTAGEKHMTAATGYQEQTQPGSMHFAYFKGRTSLWLIDSNAWWFDSSTIHALGDHGAGTLLTNAGLAVCCIQPVQGTLQAATEQTTTAINAWWACCSLAVLCCIVLHHTVSCTKPYSCCTAL